MTTAALRKKKLAAKKRRSTLSAKAKRATADAPRENCPHCRGGSESFRYMKSIYRFDIDKARALVSDGRQPVELEPDDVRFSVDTSRIYPQHVKHVNPEYPGIIAHIWYPEPDGNVLHGHVLIDGHHRAARCLELGRPYFVHLLSEEESRAILLDGPNIEEILSNLNSQISNLKSEI
jgi:hypothetical protein